MDWLMDDDMMRQWEDISKDEEEFTVTKRMKEGSYKLRRCTVHQNWLLSKRK